MSTPATSADQPTRVGRTWVYPDGTTLPVIAGGDGPIEAPTMPDDLAGLDDGQLAALVDELSTAFDDLRDEGSRDLALLTRLADNIDACRTETQRRETEAAALDDELAALTARVHADDTDADPEGDDDDSEGDDDDSDAEGADDTAAAEPEPALTAATTGTTTTRSTGNLSLRSVAQRAPTNRPPANRARRQPAVTITAAADLPGVSPGTVIDLNRVAQAMHDRARTLPKRSGYVPVARVNIPYAEDQWLTSDPAENVRRINAIVGQPTAQALVASGGWCAPSEPIFELFDIGPDLDGLFDLPSIGTRVRAGVLVPSFFGLGDAADALWTWTEEDDIAAAEAGEDAPTKPCMRIPCPEWSECRLEAEGLCVTHGNLSDRAWPELTRYFLGIVVASHAHRISSAKIAKVLADATAVTPDSSMLPSDATGDLLNVIALAVADLRSQFRLSRRRAIDVLLPTWIIEVLRANMAMRAGVDFMDVSVERVVGWLATRGIRPQFSPDYQPLRTGTASTTRWPAEVEFAVWLSGSYVSIDGGELDLGVVRDSTLNATNDFTAAWSEQFFQVCRIGPPAAKYTVPLSIDGVTACCAA